MEKTINSFKNRTTLGDKCACYYCSSKFQKNEIEEWVDDEQTAICPHCHIDSVITDDLTDNELEELHKKMFSLNRLTKDE